MRTILLSLMAGVMALASLNQTACAENAAVYAVSYFDLVPADFDKAVELLRPFAAATRKEDGNVEFTLLDEVGRRSEEHTSELQSRRDLVCRLLLEKKK